jgi:hypothetical protein
MRNDYDEKINSEEMNMPQGDKTGPMGMGPMTGRGAGLCRGNDSPGSTSAGRGRFGGSGRMGGGFGGGRRGFRHCFNATGLPGWMRFNGNAVTFQEDEIGLLKSQADYLNRSLDAVNKRLRDIEKTSSDSE